MISDQQNPTVSQSIEDLINALAEEERTTFGEIMRLSNIPVHDFKNYCSWSDESYTRNCIFENESFELNLICWDVSQGTPIHDHGGEECWVKVIEGELKETIYKTTETGKFEVVRTNISKQNDISYMIDNIGFHRLENLSEHRTMSLHLYAKPIRACQVFDEKSGLFKVRDLVYHSVPK